jgi:hypothetical protein
MDIEHQLGEAIVLCDLGVDGDCPLISELSSKLDVVERDSVVRGFGPDGAPVSFVVAW